MAKLQYYHSVGRERLRCGYTTGTCAAAAARGAVEKLMTGRAPDSVLIETPAGIAVEAELLEITAGTGWAACAVRKDGGDDPDVTDGTLVYARAERTGGAEIEIDGGVGVGRITRPGLDQPVGSAAINRVPRQMIRLQVMQALEAAGQTCGLKVTISIPEGERLAAKTFNPRLGIVGGISVLGTSGIVRPMSEAALVECLYLELDMLAAAGRRDILVTPGNYGDAFSRDRLHLSLEARASCSNYLGQCIDHAAGLGLRSILLVGHLGKLIKVAAGNMNTHSRVADGRRESLTAYTALCGATPRLVRAVFACGTTDEAVELLLEAGLDAPVMESVTAAIHEQLTRRAGPEMQIEAVVFSNRYGILGKTPGADALLDIHKNREEQT